MNIEFERKIYDDEYDDYITEKKLEDGRTVHVRFQEGISYDKGSNIKLEYNIYLVIYRKRKELSNANYECINPVNKAGMYGLLFAYNAIKEFEKYIVSQYDYKIRMRCYWGDSRRRNIYEHYLSKIGYSVKYLDGHKRFVKELQ